MKAYKILTSQLCSLNAQHIVRYKIGEWVSPVIPNSKLFVFDTLENVRLYADKFSYPYKCIFQCEVKNPVRVKRIPFSLEDVYQFWIKRLAKKRNIMTMPAPKGTLLVDKVKILKTIA